MLSENFQTKEMTNLQYIIQRSRNYFALNDVLWLNWNLLNKGIFKNKTIEINILWLKISYLSETSKLCEYFTIRLKKQKSEIIQTGW